MRTQPGTTVRAITARPRRTRATLADRLPAPVVCSGWKPRGLRNGLTFVDFLCGAGGSSAGLANAGWDLRFAANHWDVAIATHQANFPDVWHECVDVTTINLRTLPRAHALWLSPICTEASPAGGTSTGWRRSRGATHPVDAAEPVRQEGMERTRATFWEAVRYAEIWQPELVFVENVPDVVDRWALFDNWLGCMDKLGYPLDLAGLLSVNSAHIGGGNIPFAPQWRDRFYMVFVRKDIGRRFPLQPSPTALCFECGEVVAGVQYWCPAARKRPLRVGRYRRKPTSSYGQYWYVCPRGCRRSNGQPARVEPFILPAAAAIDWTDLGHPIGRDRLGPNTLRRIGVGQHMFWGQAGTSLPPFLTNANHDDHRIYLVDGQPLTARTTKIGDGLCLPPFTMIPGGRWDSGPVSMADAMRTQLANGNGSEALVTPPGSPEAFLAILRNHADAVGLDEPMPTLAARGHHHALVLPYYSKDPAFPPTEPLGTVSTRDRFALVTDTSGEAIAVRDCRFRMLRWDESASAQCLPLQDGYVILGTGEERTAQAGNAVSMNASMWLGRAAAQLLESAQPDEQHGLREAA
jgi:DNA (cytosine-5)-methyltransferase 1